MFTTKQRFNNSRRMARVLSGLTGISRMVLSVRDKPQVFIIATDNEYQKLFGGNKDLVLWSK